MTVAGPEISDEAKQYLRDIAAATHQCVIAESDPVYEELVVTPYVIRNGPWVSVQIDSTLKVARCVELMLTKQGASYIGLFDEHEHQWEQLTIAIPGRRAGLICTVPWCGEKIMMPSGMKLGRALPSGDEFGELR